MLARMQQLRVTRSALIAQLVIAVTRSQLPSARMENTPLQVVMSALHVHLDTAVRVHSEIKLLHALTVTTLLEENCSVTSVQLAMSAQILTRSLSCVHQAITL